MNWKHCFVMSASLALVGCGSATDPGTTAASPAAPNSDTASGAANVTLVTLDLPGMT